MVAFKKLVFQYLKLYVDVKTKRVNMTLTRIQIYENPRIICYKHTITPDRLYIT